MLVVAAPGGSVLYGIQTNRRVKKKNISHQVTCSGSVSIRDIFWSAESSVAMMRRDLQTFSLQD